MDPEHLDNDIWMHKFRRGDQSTLREVFEVYGGSLFYFANNLLNDPKQAEDIVAGSFIKLWRQRETFVELQNIKAYLYIITRNACRLARNTGEEIINEQESMLPANDDQEEVINRMVYKDVLNILYQEIEALPELLGKIFKLNFAEGLKPEEIALNLNMPVQYVYNNKFKALELIRDTLGKNNFMLSLALVEIICVAIARQRVF
jgi:RNA polymerase sigma-70 factor (ECF subfamily)